MKILLIALGVLLLAVAWHGLRPIPGAGGDPDTLVPVQLPLATRAPKASTESRVTTLFLAKLDTPPVHSAPGRDPWRFVEPPPSPLVPEPESRPPTPPPPFSPALPEAKPPELPLEYLGSFGPPEKKIAVFADNKRMVSALEGEVIDGKFLLERIGYESVEIRFVGYPDQPVRRLGIRGRSPRSPANGRYRLP